MAIHLLSLGQVLRDVTWQMYCLTLAHVTHTSAKYMLYVQLIDPFSHSLLTTHPLSPLVTSKPLTSLITMSIGPVMECLAHQSLLAVHPPTTRSLLQCLSLTHSLTNYLPSPAHSPVVRHIVNSSRISHTHHTPSIRCITHNYLIYPLSHTHPTLIYLVSHKSLIYPVSHTHPTLIYPVSQNSLIYPFSHTHPTLIYPVSQNSLIYSVSHTHPTLIYLVSHNSLNYPVSSTLIPLSFTLYLTTLSFILSPTHSSHTHPTYTFLNGLLVQLRISVATCLYWSHGKNNSKWRAWRRFPSSCISM